MIKSAYKKGMDQLIEYAVGEGYEYVFINHDGASMINWGYKTLNVPNAIYIQGKYSIELKTYIMLHELGHHELRKDWRRFEERFPVLAYAEEMRLIGDDKYKRRDSYVVASLEEEFAAWDEGLMLAERLGITIDMDNWVAIKSKCIKCYIVYYANLKK